MSSTIATYNLQVLSSREEEDAPYTNDDEKRVLADLPAILELAEENISKCLPVSFHVEITEWNEE